MTTLLDRLEDAVYSTRKFKGLYSVPASIVKTAPTERITILIINTPCNGFGDIVFAWKLAKILRHMYNARVKIASTQAKGLIQLGEDAANVYRLATSANSSDTHKGSIQCRRHAKLKMFDIEGSMQLDTSIYDLYFDAPIMADFEPDLAGLRRLVPNATPFNTFFMSEYNDVLTKGFDFNTGVGNGRDGILLLPPALFEVATKQDVTALVEPHKYGSYALAYIGATQSWERCVSAFTNMITHKHQLRKFQIVCPGFVAEYLLTPSVARRVFSKHYQQVVFLLKNDESETIDFPSCPGAGGTLYIRGDVLPVNNKVMMGLIRYSVRDILITGDQSLTDVLSCCKTKNIFYQIAPWKANLGHQLAKLMPQEYYEKKRTSCGTLEAIKYSSDYANFVRDNSFMKMAKPKLDGIIRAAALRKSDTRDAAMLRDFEDIVLTSRLLRTVKDKLAEEHE
jgi:hypothetical protein